MLLHKHKSKTKITNAERYHEFTKYTVHI